MWSKLSVRTAASSSVDWNYGFWLQLHDKKQLIVLRTLAELEGGAEL